MSYIFRKVHRPWWYKDRRDEFKWLEDGELVADILRDEVATFGGKLSTYVIDKDKKRLRRVIAAMASTRDSVQNFDYVLFPESELLNRYKFCSSAGDTPDAVVNQWHIDLIRFTPSSLVEFVYSLRDRRDKIVRLNKKKVESAILDGIGYGHIDFGKISEPLRISLAEKICPL